MTRVMFVNSYSEIPLAIQQVVNETVRDITRIQYNQILKKQIPFLEKIHSEYFARSSGPDNRPWGRLAPSTIHRKGHDTILIDTGRLIRSLTASTHADAVRDVDKNELIFGTSVPYSMYHQQDCGGSSPASLGRGTKRIRRVRRKRTRLSGGGFMHYVLGRAMRIGKTVLRISVQQPSVPGMRRRSTRGTPPRPHVGFSASALVKFVNNVADGMMDQLKQMWR